MKMPVSRSFTVGAGTCVDKQLIRFRDRNAAVAGGFLWFFLCRSKKEHFKGENQDMHLCKIVPNFPSHSPFISSIECAGFKGRKVFTIY
jgi:hypothetical protein